MKKSNLLHRAIAIIALVQLLLCVTSCITQGNLNRPSIQARLQKQYANALANAALPRERKIYNNLTVAAVNNPQLVTKQINGQTYLLAVSWKGDAKYYKNNPETGFYNTGKYPIWVTLAPELKNLGAERRFSRRLGLDFRLKQLLGMPPAANKQYMVEFWVKPDDLFRPCPDAETTDTACSLCFTEKTDSLHRQWINQTRLASYYNCNIYDNYPWTQLGYTYDWNRKNKTHIGLSEFVIGANKNIVVGNIYTTAEYFK
ncbi:hypothetical protein C7N43_24565 [Sphingobacteriales bacterium UPWRP_1]|nr:hypothetical protein BVG80_16900 [Sphingobacteriales bacterium TSM_CSM]PSJ74326.1 hypothetical protein C7N43_24565 [Sphingobacteriales bacterium UPWRP_1]